MKTIKQSAEMIPFNVICYSSITKKFEAYNIMPYLISVYKRKEQKPEDIRKFIVEESMCQWWSRCEYEMIIKDWPCNTIEEKWDVYKQIMMNVDVVTQIFKANISKTDQT